MASWDGAHVWLEFSGAPAELRPSGSSRVRWIDKIPTGNSEMAIIIRCPSGFEAGHFDAVQFQLTFDNTATFKWREKLLDFTRGKYLAGYKVTRLLLPVQGGLKSQKTMMRISKSSNCECVFFCPAQQSTHISQSRSKAVELQASDRLSCRCALVLSRLAL